MRMRIVQTIGAIFQTAIEALADSARLLGFAHTPDSPRTVRRLAGIGRLSNYRNDGIIQIDLDNIVEAGRLAAGSHWST